MAAEAVAPSRGRAGSAWLAATLAVTIGPIVALAAAAPTSAAPGTGFAWLLFLGSSMHVASTAWFYSVGEVRAHMRAHPLRYLAVPAALVVGAAVFAAAVDEHTLDWSLLGFFAWQFHHFQKQNLGIAALTARSVGARGLDVLERRALIGAGAGGVIALAGRPQLLQLANVPATPAVFATGVAVFAVAVAAGTAALVRRPPADRPLAFACAWLTVLLFYLPVLLFTSPYAAVAGLTIAHGLQYLLLMSMLAARPSGARTAATNLLVLAGVAVVAGLLLNRMSHLHAGGPGGRAVFGVYLGLTMTHFVVDAGLWRLRDPFARSFLGARLPYLLTPR